MTEYEYIVIQCRKAHCTQWNEAILNECTSILSKLTREQLFSIYRSKWLVDNDPLKQSIFKRLFSDKIGKREERIRRMNVDELIEEFKDKKSGNVALIREELRKRYKEGVDKQKIGDVFSRLTKGDQQWVKSQIRKQRQGSNCHT